MPKNDEGEFELILGNRQLISVFLIVVFLLGVFFSMGYIVGRNSSAAAPETARAEKPASDNPSPSAPAESSTPPPVDNASPADSVPPPPSSTQPEKPSAAPPGKKPTPPFEEARTKPSPTGNAAPVSDRVAVNGQPAGQYWQVVATARPDAEIIAEALAKKGFHAMLSPAPKDGVFRVLVGPLADAATLAQTRTNLEAAGFKNPIMRKY